MLVRHSVAKYYILGSLLLQGVLGHLHLALYLLVSLLLESSYFEIRLVVLDRQAKTKDLRVGQLLFERLLQGHKEVKLYLLERVSPLHESEILLLVRIGNWRKVRSVVQKNVKS